MILNLRTLLHILLLHSMAVTTNFLRRRIHKGPGFPGLWMPRMEMPSFKAQAHLMSLQRKTRLLPGPRSRTALDKQGRSLLRFSCRKKQEKGVRDECPHIRKGISSLSADERIIYHEHRLSA